MADPSTLSASVRTRSAVPWPPSQRFFDLEHVVAKATKRSTTKCAAAMRPREVMPHIFRLLLSPARRGVMVKSERGASHLTSRRYHHQYRISLGGALLAFTAVAVQAILPFIVAIALVRATNPAYADESICSAFGSAAHDQGGKTSDHGGAIGCPICNAVAASHVLASPPPLLVSLPVSCGTIAFSVTDASIDALVAVSFYQSRAPPTLA